MDVALSIQMAKALRLRNIYLYLFIFNNNLLYLFRNINICLCMFLMHLTRIFRTQQQIDDPQPGVYLMFCSNLRSTESGLYI